MSLYIFCYKTFGFEKVVPVYETELKGKGLNDNRYYDRYNDPTNENSSTKSIYCNPPYSRNV